MPDSTLTQNESNGGIITPIVCVRPVCMPLTSRFRRQPSCREASEHAAASFVAKPLPVAAENPRRGGQRNVGRLGHVLEPGYRRIAHMFDVLAERVPTAGEPVPPSDGQRRKPMAKLV